VGMAGSRLSPISPSVPQASQPFPLVVVEAGRHVSPLCHSLLLLAGQSVEAWFYPLAVLSPVPAPPPQRQFKVWGQLSWMGRASLAAHNTGQIRVEDGQRSPIRVPGATDGPDAPWAKWSETLTCTLQTVAFWGGLPGAET
jgi:hypothetical protein